jgi:hypothetical protein
MSAIILALQKLSELYGSYFFLPLMVSSSPYLKPRLSLTSTRSLISRGTDSFASRFGEDLSRDSSVLINFLDVINSVGLRFRQCPSLIVSFYANRNTSA